MTHFNNLLIERVDVRAEHERHWHGAGDYEIRAIRFVGSLSLLSLRSRRI